jgi:hypothetical protein
MRGMATVNPPCEHLAFLLNYELERGNRVDSVIEKDGHSRVTLAHRLYIWGTPDTGRIGAEVAYWDSLAEMGLTADECEMMDNPPPVMSGFLCRIHRHIIAAST